MNMSAVRITHMRCDLCKNRPVKNHCQIYIHLSVYLGVSRRQKRTQSLRTKLASPEKGEIAWCPRARDQPAININITARALAQSIRKWSERQRRRLEIRSSLENGNARCTYYSRLRAKWLSCGRRRKSRAALGNNNRAAAAVKKQTSRC